MTPDVRWLTPQENEIARSEMSEGTRAEVDAMMETFEKVLKVVLDVLKPEDK